MEAVQVVHVEYLITGILQKGLLNKLTEETNFCSGRCNYQSTSAETGSSLNSYTSSTCKMFLPHDTNLPSYESL